MSLLDLPKHQNLLYALVMTNEINPETTEDELTIKATYAVYILYLLLFFPALPFLGVVIAYVFENDAKFILKSHYTYLIRTFWIGLLYFSIASIFTLLLIGFLLLPLCVIWWYVRSVKGLKSLMRNEPISNSTTWLV